MKFKSKKAMSTGFLVGIIITIIAFMLIAGTIIRWQSSAEDKQVESLCTQSIAIRAASTVKIPGKVWGSTEVKLSPILCKTQDKKLELDDNEEVKAKFADYMTRCWRMFGEGKYKTNVFSNTNLFASDANCFVCFTILTDANENFGKISGQDFEKYLRTTKYPKKKGMTYLDYFQYGAGQGYVMNIFTQEGISPGRAYAIAFKGKSEGGKLTSTLAGAGGAAVVVGGLGLLTVGSGGLLLLAGGAVAAYTVPDLFNTPINVDGIYVVDLDKSIQKEFYKGCNVIADTAGR